MNRRFINTILKKKVDFTLEEDHKRTLAESFLESVGINLFEADSTSEKDERLQKLRSLLRPLDRRLRGSEHLSRIVYDRQRQQFHRLVQPGI